MLKKSILKLLFVLLFISSNAYSQCDVQCYAPTNLMVVDTTSTTITFNWDDGATAESWHYILKFGSDTLLEDTCYSKPLTIYMDTFNVVGQLTFTVSAFCHDYVGSDLIITSVFHNLFPSGNPHGVEVYAARDIQDLSIYGIGVANDGGGSDGIEYTFPNISVSQGTFLYVTNDSTLLANSFSLSNVYQSQAIDIDGNDAVELYENGTPIDYYGYPDTNGVGTDWFYPYWAYRNCYTENDSTFHLEHWYIPLPDSLICTGNPNIDSLQAYPPFGNFGISEGGESGSTTIPFTWGCQQGGGTGMLQPFGTFGPYFTLDYAISGGVPSNGEWTDPMGNPHTNNINYLIDDCGIYNYTIDEGNGCPPIVYSVDVLSYFENVNMGVENYCTNDTLIILDYFIDPNTEIIFNGSNQNMTDIIELSNVGQGTYNLSSFVIGPCYYYEEYYNINVSTSPNAGDVSDTVLCYDGHMFTQDANLLIGNHDINGTWVDLNNPQVIDVNGVITVTQEGLLKFMYIVESAICGNDTNFVFVDVTSCTSINNINDRLVKIYPNPTNNLIYIEANYIITNYTLYDNLGQVVLRGKYNGFIDLSRLNKGVYSIRIEHSEGIYNSTIIKE